MKASPGLLNRQKAELEDQIYLQMDKLLALCGMQSLADANDCQVPLGLRTNYSAVLEEQALALRKLLDQAFG
ncbi:hypothetical protein ACXYTJ_06235 [Gilvimarinus sp. F26214L]|uniref:hypothetical protein n=1 Tax=Gilvimarinus sp. DZF01 TaxID=3461371 RepID=UPI0040463221